MKISEIEPCVISGTGDTSYNVSLRNIGSAIGVSSLLVHEETLQPGENGSRPHYHTVKEEMIVVLHGILRVTYGEDTQNLEPGSVFGFPAGAEIIHFVTNIGSGEATYLSISSVSESDKVVYA